MARRPTPARRRYAIAGSTQPVGQKTSYLRPLAGLRFVAALLVVAFHFLLPRMPGATGPLGHATTVARNVVAGGFSGVDFFFILSGFILSYSYLDARGRLAVSPRAFWLARVARIYPIYVVAFAAAAIPFLQWGAQGPPPCGQPHPIVTGVAGLTLTQGWLPCAANVWNPPAWSLSVEAFFYLLFPTSVFLIGRLSRRGLLTVVVAMWAALAAVALAYLVVAPDGAASGPWYDRFWLRALYGNPLARLPEFLMGVALGKLFMPRSADGAIRLARRVGHRWRPGLVGAAALLGIVGLLAAGPSPVVLVNEALLDPLFALLIYALAFGEGPLARFFALPLLGLLGEASYALYILHWPLWDWSTRAVERFVDPAVTQSAAFFAAYLCVAVVVSVLSLRFVERPARAALKRLFARERRRHILASEPAA